VLGAGACDTSFSVGRLTTDGAGSTGALIRGSGDTNSRIGVLQTNGLDAAGVDIASNPTACVILGVGGCDTTLTADQVSTRGDGAAGVLINSPGQIVTNLGLVSTQGNDSTGLGITQDPAVCLAIGPGSCGTRATTGTATTAGDNSRGIDIASPGPIALDATRVTSTGANSDAIRVAGVDGPISISSGTVTTAGLASNGIVANATACANIDITARDDVISAQGSAIVAQSQCNVAVTTLAGATVSGRTAGIDVTSGTGAVIRIGDTLSSAAGPALNVDGAAANVTIAATGAILGRVDLTASNDVLTNNGLFAPLGTSDFGAGVDRLVNNGTLRADGDTRLISLEELFNGGLVNLADGAVGDQLTLSGNFVGGPGSRLAIDVNGSVAGTPADRLVVGGSVTGTTALTVNRIGTGPAVANPTGVVVVDGAPGSTGTFTLQGPLRSGFVDFSLRQAAGDTLLVASPNELAIEPLLLGRIGQEFWYQSADAWSETAALRRHDLGTENAKPVSVWAQGYGSSDKRGDRSRSVVVFGTSRDSNLRIDTDRQGAQVGVDVRPGSGMFAIGLTGGYQHAESDFASGTRSDAAGYNVGAYALFGGMQGLYGEVLAKADFFDVGLSKGTLFDGGDIDGKSYGVEGELGFRTGLGSFNLDLGGGLAYVRTDLDGFGASGFAFDFDRADSLRGRFGVRVGGRGPGFMPYLDAKVLHEFKGGNDASFTSGGFTQTFADRNKGTWFRGEVGLAGSADRFGGFLSAFGEVGDVRGYGLRAGFRW
jgi:outer membrane autotransporter protein